MSNFDLYHGSDPWVVVTHHGTDPRAFLLCRMRQANGEQVYRLDSSVNYETLNPVWDEKFLIPGITGDCVVSAGSGARSRGEG
jgi:hypothetical protein